MKSGAEESMKDSGYSEEHIKQMTGTKHNQWELQENQKKLGTLIHDKLNRQSAHRKLSGEKSQQKHLLGVTFTLVYIIVIN